MESQLLILLVCASAVTDIRERRIYDAFTFPAIVAGLLLALLRGPEEILWSLGGLAVGASVFYPFYRVGGMGMGDLKLMAAIGSLGGLEFVLAATVDTALAGGIIAMILLARRGNVLSTLGRTGKVFRALLSRGRDARLDPATEAETVPYGVAICIGTLAAMFIRWPW